MKTEGGYSAKVERQVSLVQLARPKGVEPPTLGSEVSISAFLPIPIQSY